MHTTHATRRDALTEFVRDSDLMTYRRAVKRAGLVIVLSSPTLGGYYVTTATRPVVTR
jgi:hypothetical protein